MKKEKKIENRSEGFIISDKFEAGNNYYQYQTTDEEGDRIDSYIHVKDGFFDMNSVITDGELFQYAITRFYKKYIYQLDLYYTSYQKYFVNKKEDSKYRRNDLRNATFLASLGDIVGVRVDSSKLDAFFLALPKNVFSIGIEKIALLFGYEDRYINQDNLNVILCDGNYENSKILNNDQSIELLKDIKERYLSGKYIKTENHLNKR